MAFSPTTFPRRILESPLGRRLAVGAVGTLVVRGLGAAATVGNTALLARLLGPHDYGIYAYAVSWTLLLGTIAGLGLDVLATREIAQARARGEAGTVRAFVRWSTRLVALAGIGAALLLAAVAALLPDAWKPEAAAGLLYIAPAVIAVAGTQLAAGILRGFQHVVFSYALDLLIKPMLLLSIAGILAVVQRLDALTVSCAYVLTAFLSLAIAYALVLRELNRAYVSSSSASLKFSMWSSATRWMLAVRLGSMALTHIPILSLGSLSSPAQVAIYDISMKITSITSFGLFAVDAAAAPIVAQIWGERDLNRLRRVYKYLTIVSASFALLTGSLIVILVLLFGDSLFYPSGYTRAVCLTLLVGQVINAACGPVGSLLNMIGDERHVARTLIVAAAVASLVSPHLAYFWGALGVATSTAAVTALWHLILRLRARQRLRQIHSAGEA